MKMQDACRVSNRSLVQPGMEEADPEGQRSPADMHHSAFELWLVRQQVDRRRGSAAQLPQACWQWLGLTAVQGDEVHAVKPAETQNNQVQQGKRTCSPHSAGW